MKKEQYTCPCCDYKTPRKDNMRIHLYNLKKPCPKIHNNIDLTDDIKEFILQNRVYHVEKPVDEQKVINQTINNYNCMQNFVANMDVLDKLNKFTEHNKIELVDFEEKIEETYMLTSKKLDEDKFKYGYQLKTENFMELIDSISSLLHSKIEYYNLLHDGNKLKLYERGVWRSFLIEQGVKQMLTITKDYYLDSYECFLMRKIKKHQTSVFDIQKSKELLIQYYKFIGCFEIDPYCKDHYDHEILKLEEDVSNDEFRDEYSLEFYAYYRKATDKLTRSEITKMKKDVIDIVKRNTTQNIQELNKKVMSLIQMDEEFKRNFMKPPC
jgi:hypothetical protein